MSSAHDLWLVARRHVDLCRVFSAACFSDMRRMR
ncbi:putative leader peptide [Haloglycomyces albus]